MRRLQLIVQGVGQTDVRIRLDKVFPKFSVELTRLIRESSKPELAIQVAKLSVVARCQCGESNCAHFYTVEPPDGGYGEAHKNVMLSPADGLIVLDVVQNEIVAVEVLDRPDVRERLDTFLPSKGASGT